MNPAYHKPVFEYIPAGKPTDFWVITAYNPDGKNTDPGTNAAADARLHADITVLGIRPFRIIGMSPDATHAEPGWGVPCDETTAIEIGRRYRQEAVYHFTADRIDLVDCKTGERHPLDDPASRVLDPRDARHFTLFVGSPDDRKKLDPAEYTEVCTRVRAVFSGFTVQHAQGCFQSRFEDTLMIHIATREPIKVLTLAHELRCFLNQDGIGISHNGIYQRVRDWSDDSLILESFGLG
jgi:hypothetical protein